MTRRVVLVDDQELIRTGFRMVLESAGVEVVGEAADGAQGVEVVRETQPDVVLMDVRMPRMDGVAATAAIVGGSGGGAPAAASPAAGAPAAASPAGSVADDALPADGPPRVIILTTFDLDEYVYEALRAGASAFLLKDTPPAQLVNAIEVVSGGHALLGPTVTRRLIGQFAEGFHTVAEDDRLAALTGREREVLELVAHGLSNAEIAERLYVGEATIKTHVGHVLLKLGLRDRVQAVVVAYEVGLVRPGSAAGP